jgi:hypothetical protein
MLYYCNECIICTSNRADYNKHIQTKKHNNNLKKKGKKVVDISESTNDPDANVNTNVTLNVSDIPTNHIDESHHKKSFNKDKQCKYCGGCYSHLSGLSRHIKKCSGTFAINSKVLSQQNDTHDTNNNINSIINILLHENAEFKQMIVDVMKNNQDTTNKVIEICKNNQSSVTTNIYNHKGDNNTFNLNVFLNEKCKDAMNMTDFVNTIEVTMDDMENVGRRGYVEGISSIFIDNLKNTDVHKRPIHCSDRKREVLYVKDADRWERDDVNSNKLKHAVLVVEQKHMGLVNKWADEHPGCEKSDNRANNLYMNICRNVTDGNDEKILKIVKNIAKETVIEKYALIL